MPSGMYSVSGCDQIRHAGSRRERREREGKRERARERYIVEREREREPFLPNSEFIQNIILVVKR